MANLPDSPIPDALWNAVIERDLAWGMCETWSSVVVEQRIELETERQVIRQMKSAIKEILRDDNTSGQVRSLLAELIAE